MFLLQIEKNQRHEFSYEFFIDAAMQLKMTGRDLDTLTRLMRKEKGVKVPPYVMKRVHDAKHALDDHFDVVEKVKKSMIFS